MVPGCHKRKTFYEGHSFYERHAALTWWFVMARIGQGLRSTDY